MFSKFTLKAVKAAASNKTSSFMRPATTSAAWSGRMSYSSPESDFYVGAPARKVDSSIPEWSRTMSFASAEADFTDCSDSVDTASTAAHVEDWSGSLSFSSPEADFTCEPLAPDYEWSEHLSFASPEADFSSAAMMDKSEQQQAIEHTLEQSAAVMQLAVSSPESACGHMHAHHYFDSHEIVRLHHERTAALESALPASLNEALDADETRAIVVTEANAPFNIVDVNDAWVNLCEFSKEEARQHSLNMIQGPETNNQALTSMVDELLSGQEASTLVTNYTKAGRKFYNRLRAGPIYNDQKEVTHFVGILQEVTEEPEFFHTAHA